MTDRGNNHIPSLSGDFTTTFPPLSGDFTTTFPLFLVK
jgi:hypothetical protein